MNHPLWLRAAIVISFLLLRWLFQPHREP